jgi:hypothetical protein
MIQLLQITKNPAQKVEIVGGLKLTLNIKLIFHFCCMALSHFCVDMLGVCMMYYSHQPIVLVGGQN